MEELKDGMAVTASELTTLLEQSRRMAEQTKMKLDREKEEGTRKVSSME